MTPIALNVIKTLLPAILSFLVGIAITPTITNFMYKYRLWRRKSRSQENIDAMSEDFKKIHNERGEVSTPRVGGVIVWLSVIITIFLLYITALVFPNEITQKLSFLSRNQTLLPLAFLLLGSFFGLIDDLLQIYKSDAKIATDGISRKLRILFIILIGSICAWWFFFKLQVLSIHIPFYGEVWLGLLFIPFLIIVMLGVFSGSVIDGIDGLAAGTMIPAYGAYLMIALSQNQIDLAAFCAVVIGGLLAFLWFNIPPARFYLGETGMLGLTVALTIVAFLTREVILIPIIAFPLFITSLSSSLQMFSKKYFGKKILRIAPLHHHFEAIGWPSYKVTMRYWIIATVMAIIGTIIAIIG
jgi:phospho-N-acetylmuramoyl-pentapeptide-transferase